MTQPTQAALTLKFKRSVLHYDHDRADWAGLGVSLFLHAGLIVVALGFFSKTTSRLPAPEVVPVDIVTIAEAPSIKEAPKPSIAAAPRETILEAPDTPEREKAPPETVADKEAVPLPNQKPDTGKRFDSKKLSSLIDKSLQDADRKPVNFSALATKLERDLPKTAQVSPFEAASLAQAMMGQILRCASFPVGGEGLERMRVMVRIQLTEQGQVVGQPLIVETEGQTPDNVAFFRVFVESVKRAILRCQPYSLPADKFQVWREQDINVNPRDVVR